MKTLDQTIREAAKDRRLAGLTLWPCELGWQANALFKRNKGWLVEHDADPVVALNRALGIKPQADNPATDNIFE